MKPLRHTPRPIHLPCPGPQRRVEAESNDINIGAPKIPVPFTSLTPKATRDCPMRRSGMFELRKCRNLEDHSTTEAGASATTALQCRLLFKLSSDGESFRRNPSRGYPLTRVFSQIDNPLPLNIFYTLLAHSGIAQRAM